MPYNYKRQLIFAPLSGAAERRINMGNVYSLDAGRNLIIYESGNTLYIRTTIGEGLTRPVTLCTDFADSFSDTVHNDTVYFCYINTSHDIVVRSITDLQELYKIDSREMPDCRKPCLVSFCNMLLLFYVIKNPLNDTYCLKALFPFEVQRHILLPERCFTDVPEIKVLCSKGHMLVDAADGESQLILCFDAEMTYAVWDGTGADEDALEKIKQSAAACEERLKALQGQKAHLEEELEKIKQEKDQIIASIRAQYEELMDTALKYKEDAAKWHELAYKRDARPIPGERLLSDSW